MNICIVKFTKILRSPHQQICVLFLISSYFQFSFKNLAFDYVHILVKTLFKHVNTFGYSASHYWAHEYIQIFSE